MSGGIGPVVDLRPFCREASTLPTLVPRTHAVTAVEPVSQPSPDRHGYHPAQLWHSKLTPGSSAVNSYTRHSSPLTPRPARAIVVSGTCGRSSTHAARQGSRRPASSVARTSKRAARRSSAARPRSLRRSRATCPPSSGTRTSRPRRGPGELDRAGRASTGSSVSVVSGSATSTRQTAGAPSPSSTQPSGPTERTATRWMPSRSPRSWHAGRQPPPSSRHSKLAPGPRRARRRGRASRVVHLPRRRARRAIATSRVRPARRGAAHRPVARSLTGSPDEQRPPAPSAARAEARGRDRRARTSGRARRAGARTAAAASSTPLVASSKSPAPAALEPARRSTSRSPGR